MSVAEGERILIIRTLEACGDNRTKAAEMLNISIRTLRNKLHEYKLQDPEG
jgi:DNA-binding NtrC family response regulator